MAKALAGFCKWFFIGTSGLLALLGMFFCAVALYALLSLPPGGNHYYIGKEACAESLAGQYLPLPEQENAQDFPMVWDCNGMCDSCGFVIFRATPEWQAAFRHYYARPPRIPHGTVGMAEGLAEQTENARIRAFIESRKWQHVHDCNLWQRGSAFRDCTALRDASGEYVLLYFRTF